MSEQQDYTNPMYPYYYPYQSYYPVYDYRALYPQQQFSRAEPQGGQQFPQTTQQFPQSDQQFPQAQQQFPQFPTGAAGEQGGTTGTTGTPGETGMLPPQQSYIENILRLNKGKAVTVYMTFESGESGGGGREQVFKGVIEAAGRDHIILSDPETGMRYLLLMVYLDYITFNEEINYAYPFGGAAGPGLATYPPR